MRLHKTPTLISSLLLFASVLLGCDQQSSFLITGGEQTSSGVSDTGTVTLTINNSYSQQVQYGKFSTNAGIASAFGGTLSQDPHAPANAQANGQVLTLRGRSTSSAHGALNSVAFSAVGPLNSFSCAALPPTFSLASGTYTQAQTVNVADGTLNSTIYYTTDGSDPTTSSPVASGSIPIYASETLRAIAVIPGCDPSTVSSAVYVMNFPTAQPVFSPIAGTYPTAQTVTVSDDTPGATIRFTTDGSAPTSSSAIYTGPLAVSSTETLQAVAFAPGSSSSPTASATYTIVPYAATPAISPAAGSYASAQTVTLTSATPGSTIYYTSDGTVPTSSSTAYSAPISVTATETVQAISIASGFTPSQIASAAYDTGPSSAISIAVVNPNLLPTVNSTSGPTIADSAVLQALSPALAQGIVEDGTSTAIILVETPTQSTIQLTLDDHSGAILRGWNSGFIASPPVAVGPSTISIACNDPNKIDPANGNYYALALVQAPDPQAREVDADGNVIYEDELSITAERTDIVGSSPATATLNVIPHPVILVHGLWSDGNAFTSLSPFLQSSQLSPYAYPYVDITAGTGKLSLQYRASLLNRISYSKTLSYDAPPSTPSTPSPDGSKPAIQSLEEGLDKIYAVLDYNQIIGGRVDVIAHSMGGLVAQYFAASTAYSYKTPRDLQQGRFYSVFTIDTPHQGSGLANFLTDHAKETYQPSLVPFPSDFLSYALWHRLCHAGETLAACFTSELQKPLSYAGDEQTYLNGAVGSLRTDYSGNALNHTSFPYKQDIDGVLPAYLAAEYIDPTVIVDGPPSTGTSTLPSAMRAFVQAMIDAVDPSAPTLDSELESTRSDAIVTVASQYGGSTASLTPISNYAHSTVGSALKQLEVDFAGIDYYSDNNVMEADAVNTKVLCWLMSLTQCTSYQQSTAQNAIGAQHAMVSQASPMGAMSPAQEIALAVPRQARQYPRALPNRHIDENYVTIVPPTRQAVLGESFDIELKLKQQDVENVSVIQSDWLTPMGSENMLEESFEHPTVQHRSNGEAYVSITPVRLGKVKLSFSGVSLSGAMFDTSVVVYVGEPAKTPSKLVITHGYPPTVVMFRLGMSSHNSVGEITAANAFYEGIKQPFLIDPHFIRYRIRGTGNQEVITIDHEKGVVRSLSPGHAILEASYGGLTTQTCVVVVQDANLLSADHSDCSELLSPNHK